MTPKAREAAAPHSSRISVATRILVGLSAAMAALTLGYVAPHPVRVPSVVAACAGLLSGFLPWRLRRLVLAGVLAAMYVTPVAFRVSIGHNYYAYVLVWIAGLLGAVASRDAARGWSLPPRWRWPLVTWALTLAVTWPIVAYRELDFVLDNLWEYRLPIATVKISGRASVEWVAYNVLTYLGGILFLDWLFLRYGGARDRFLRDVALPLGTALVVACGVGLYQGLVDIGFLSGHLWPIMRRATGTLMDANVFGVLAALWGPAFLVLGFTLHSGVAVTAGVAALLLSWTGVWTSGSRIAAFTATVGCVLSLIILMRRLQSRKARVQLGLGVSVGVVALAAAITFVPSLSETAVARARYLVPERSLASLRQTLEVLWARDGYGTTATGIIREHPIIGTGVGTFNTLVHDFAVQVASISIPSDNAQNWYRHQLAELGVLGSLGWMAWVVVFVLALWSTPGMAEGLGSALRGPLVAFGAGSLLGMPGQDPAVAFTFWVLVFWFALDTGIMAGPSQQVSAKAWVATFLIVGAYAAVRAAPADLRPPFRAVRFGFPYSYGFDFESNERTWSDKRGVTVVGATDNYLRLTYWVDHPDADTRPVQVEIWRNHERIVNRRLRQGVRETTYVPVEKGKRFVLEVKIDRTFRPSDHGAADTRELGLAMRWDFVPAAP